MAVLLKIWVSYRFATDGTVLASFAKGPDHDSFQSFSGDSISGAIDLALADMIVRANRAVILADGKITEISEGKTALETLLGDDLEVPE